MDNSSLRPLLSLSWQSLAYGAGVMGQQVVTYLMLPILTLYLDQAAFGVISVLIAFFSLINIISNAGLPAATFRIYNESDDPDIQAQVLSTSQVMFICYAAVLALVVFSLSKQISNWLLGSPNYANLFRIISVYLVIYTLTNYGQIVLRIEVRPLAKSIHNILWTLAEYGLAIWFVVQLSQGVEGYWWGRLLGSTIGLVGILWLIRRSIYWKFSRTQLSEMLKYALPIIPIDIAFWALRLIDRTLITKTVGLNEVGIYEVGVKVGMLTSLVSVPFLVAWPQFAFSAMRKPNAPVIYRNVLTFLATSSAFLGLGVILFRAELVNVLSTPAYESATRIVPWIVLGQIAWALYPVLSVGPRIKKNTWVLTWVTGVAAAANIGINLILIPRIGIQGAAFSTFFGFVFLGSLSYAVGQKSFSFPLDWKRFIKLIIASLLTYSIVEQIHQFGFSHWLDLALRALSMGTLFWLILLVLQFISWKDLLRLKNLIIAFVHGSYKELVY